MEKKNKNRQRGAVELCHVKELYCNPRTRQYVKKTNLCMKCRSANNHLQSFSHLSEVSLQWKVFPSFSKNDH